MLEEIRDVSQVSGEPRRRWFWDDFFDLIVWHDETNRPIGFQLCYDKGAYEHALTWMMGRGFMHTAVGTDRNRLTRGGVLEARDGGFPRERVLRQFRESALNLEPPLLRFVEGGLTSFPSAFEPYGNRPQRVSSLKELSEAKAREPIRLGRRLLDRTRLGGEEAAA